MSATVLSSWSLGHKRCSLPTIGQSYKKNQTNKRYALKIIIDNAFFSARKNISLMLVIEAEILDILCYSVPHYWLFLLYIQVSITSDNDLL